jgi:hypothetical protein
MNKRRQATVNAEEATIRPIHESRDGKRIEAIHEFIVNLLAVFVYTFDGMR